MKSILKKVSGVLKYAATAIPALLLAFGIGATAGGLAESAVNTNTLKEFYASQPVQQVIDSELEALDNSVAAEEITFTDAAGQYEQIKSDKHLKEVADEVYKGDAKYEASVKTVVRDYALITSGLLSLAAGIFTGYLWYVDKEGTAARLKESADDDFAYSKDSNYYFDY